MLFVHVCFSVRLWRGRGVIWTLFRVEPDSVRFDPTWARVDDCFVSLLTTMNLKFEMILVLNFNSWISFLIQKVNRLTVKNVYLNTSSEVDLLPSKVTDRFIQGQFKSGQITHMQQPWNLTKFTSLVPMMMFLLLDDQLTPSCSLVINYQPARSVCKNNPRND